MTYGIYMAIRKWIQAKASKKRKKLPYIAQETFNRLLF